MTYHGGQLPVSIKREEAEAAFSTVPRPRLLAEVRNRLRLKHYSLRTEKAYLYWIRRYIHANGLRHPR